MKLTIRPAARRDVLRQFGHYLSLGLPQIGDRFLDATEAAIGLMFASPQAGSPRRFANPLLVGLRSWPVKNFEEFRVYYLHRPDEVAVVRILHGRRDIRAILEGAGTR